jgi:transposase-like protein
MKRVTGRRRIASVGCAASPVRDELNRLRRENRQLRVERDILSKAAAWFARETNAIPAKGSES